MSLDKKGFAEIIEAAINECKYISAHNRSFAEKISGRNSYADCR